MAIRELVFKLDMKPHTIDRFSGVYVLIRKRKIVYVGRSIDVDSRIRAHMSKIKFDQALVKRCSIRQATKLEFKLIAKFIPPLNNCGVKKRYARARA
jgi:hypothetical protein